MKRCDCRRRGSSKPVLRRARREARRRPVLRGRRAAGGAAKAAVISYSLWQRLFAGTNEAIGAKLPSGSSSITVVGVMPKGLEYPPQTDVFLARETESALPELHRGKLETPRARQAERHDRPGASGRVAVLRRLKAQVGDFTYHRRWNRRIAPRSNRRRDSADPAPALRRVRRAAADRVHERGESAGGTNGGARGRARRARRARRGARTSHTTASHRGGTSLAVWMRGGSGVGVRRSEAAARAATGVDPSAVRVERRLARHGVRDRRSRWPSAIALGLVAAWRGVRGDLRAALSQSQRSQGGGAASYGMRSALVVVQLSMTVILMVAAGVLGRSFMRLITSDAGFRTQDVAIVTLVTETGDFFSAADERIARKSQLLDDVMALARRTPGVSAVGAVSNTPLSGGGADGGFLVLESASEKLQPSDFERMFKDKSRTGQANYRLASADYFKTIGIPLVRRSPLRRSGSPRRAARRGDQRVARQITVAERERDRQSARVRKHGWRRHADDDRRRGRRRARRRTVD